MDSKCHRTTKNTEYTTEKKGSCKKETVQGRDEWEKMYGINNGIDKGQKKIEGN
jgi:hypothetical protein